MAVLSFLILLCVAFSSPTAGLRLPERVISFDPYITETGVLDIPFCRRGWIDADDRCYKLFIIPKTWNRALADCKMRGGNLISIRNEDDLFMVQSLIGLPGQPGVWIGGSDAVTEEQWQWSDGEPFSATFWSLGQPDNLGEEDCMTVDVKGLEYDENCNKKLPYVCYTKHT